MKACTLIQGEGPDGEEFPCHRYVGEWVEDTDPRCEKTIEQIIKDYRVKYPDVVDIHVIIDIRREG